MRRFVSGFPILILAIMVPSLASAHTGVDTTMGLAHGLEHPLSGADHILAMLAVGIFAVNLGSRAMRLVPVSFVAMMAVGGALGMAGIAMPLVEIGIALSVIVFGLAVAMHWNLPIATAMALTGFFAVFHGHAHGTEMPLSAADATGISYALGFMLATAILHSLGIGLGLGISVLANTTSRRLMRAGGGAMTLAGAAMLAGLV